MNSVNFFSTLLKDKWLVEPVFAMSQGTVISSILNKTVKLDKAGPDPLSAFAVLGSVPSGIKYSWYNGFDKAPAGSVAVISLRGPLTKSDQFCGPAGMTTIGQIVRAADTHHNIAAIVLHVDSPGGTVDGTEALGKIIKETTKPVVTFVDGLMASAALWIGSCADEIIASTDTDEIGSVGVVMRFMDIQPYYEKKGVKFHSMVASTSPDKTKMFDDLREGKYDSYIRDFLDPIDEKFMAVIRENRPAVEDKHLTGKLFFARDVMGIFVDAIGTLDDAILRASELAGAQSAENSNSNSNIQTMKQFEKVNAALGVDSLESVDDSVSLNADQLQSIETALEQTDVVQGRLDQANADLDSANTERDTAVIERDDTISALDAIDETVAAAETVQEKVSAIRTLLSERPGASATTVLDEKDKDAKTDANADWDTIDELEHNKNVD